MEEANQSAARFTLELPLVVGRRQVREIERRMEAHRQVYNAALGEGLKRYHRMQSDRRWRKTGAMLKGKERTQAFRDLNEEFGFTQYDLQKFACELAGNFYMKPYLGSSNTEETSSRAFTAVQMCVFKKRGEPRFKGKHRLHCVGTHNHKNLLDRQNKAGEWVLRWGRMEMRMRRETPGSRERDWDDLALNCPTKTVRVVRRTINGKWRYYVQMVKAGHSPARYVAGDDTVALDFGVSTVAVMQMDRNENIVRAVLEDLQPERGSPACKRAAERETLAKKLQRRIQSSVRKNNPAAFDAKGQRIKGVRLRHTKNCCALLGKLRNLRRKEQAGRKTSAGNFSNRVIGQGKHLRFEDVSIHDWQKDFGGSIGRCAPGMITQMLERKAASAGGTVTRINPYTTKLSQYHHETGAYKKKDLRDREVVLKAGFIIQRDIYSAWLALFADEHKLHVEKLQAWLAAHPTALERVLGWTAACASEPPSRSRPKQVPCAVRTPRRVLQVSNTERKAGGGTHGNMDAFLPERVRELPTTATVSK